MLTRQLVLATWAVLVCSTASFAQDAVGRLLEQDAKLDCVEFPAVEVLEFLSEAYLVKFKLDEAPDSKVEEKLRKPVGHCVSNVSLRSALSLALRDVGLTYVVLKDDILVTTPTRARELAMAAPGAKVGIHPLTDREKRILAALSSKTSFDFKATKLSDVVATLEKEHQVEFDFDTRIIYGGMLRPSKVRVTFSAGDLGLSQALTNLLTPIGLIFVMRDETIFITTEANRFEPGDFLTTDMSIPLRAADDDSDDDSKVIATLPAGALVEVLEVRPSAILGAAQIDGKPVSGWADKGAARATIPADLWKRE